MFRQLIHVPKRAARLSGAPASSEASQFELDLSIASNSPSSEAAPLSRVQPRWGWEALRGRLVELTDRDPDREFVGGPASLTAAIGLVYEAQLEGEPVGWITSRDSTFYPPDLVRSGIDLYSLPVIRTLSPTQAGRAAERLLRSGGFGLVVLDLASWRENSRRPLLPIALQGRLIAMAQRHRATVVCITSQNVLGSMVSLRALAQHQTSCHSHLVSVHVLKDKKRGPGWSHEELVRAVPGMDTLSDLSTTASRSVSG